MNKILQFPLVRMIIAVLFVGIGITVGQTILNLLRSEFSITNIGGANLLALVLVTPATYLAYWIYVHYIEKRDLTRSEEHTSELQSPYVISYAVFCLKKKKES